MGGRLGSGIGGVVTPFTYTPGGGGGSEMGERSGGPGLAGPAALATGVGLGAAAAHQAKQRSTDYGYPQQDGYQTASFTTTNPRDSYYPSQPHSPPPPTLSDSGTGSGATTSSGGHHNLPPRDPQYTPQGGGYPNMQPYPNAQQQPYPGQLANPGGHPGAFYPAAGAAAAMGAGAAVGAHGRSASMSSSGHTGSGSGTASRSAKEREAFARSAGPGGLGVANPDGEGGSAGGAGIGDDARRAYLAGGPGPGRMGGVPASVGGGSGVVVHRDGGRVVDEGEQEGDGEQAEIPPTYDSIPLGERR
jgi:hypothetical protein